MTLQEMTRREQRELAACFAALVNEVARIEKARDGVSYNDFIAGEIGQFIESKARVFEQQRLTVRALIAAGTTTTTEGK